MPTGVVRATQAPNEPAPFWVLYRSLLNTTWTVAATSSPNSHLNLRYFVSGTFSFYPGCCSAHLFFLYDPVLGVIFICLWTLCITHGHVTAWMTTEPTAKHSAVSSAWSQGTLFSYIHGLPVVISIKALASQESTSATDPSQGSLVRPTVMRHLIHFQKDSISCWCLTG